MSNDVSYVRKQAFQYERKNMKTQDRRRQVMTLCFRIGLMMDFIPSKNYTSVLVREDLEKFGECFVFTVQNIFIRLVYVQRFNIYIYILDRVIHQDRWTQDFCQLNN